MVLSKRHRRRGFQCYGRVVQNEFSENETQSNIYSVRLRCRLYADRIFHSQCNSMKVWQNPIAVLQARTSLLRCIHAWSTNIIKMLDPQSSPLLFQKFEKSTLEKAPLEEGPVPRGGPWYNAPIKYASENTQSSLNMDSLKINGKLAHSSLLFVNFRLLGGMTFSFRLLLWACRHFLHNCLNAIAGKRISKTVPRYQKNPPSPLTSSMH